MDIHDLKGQLEKCDRDQPFVFVSYSSQDRELVWEDVRMLQHRGYNVWLDEVNLDKTKESWREDALAAISDLNCMLVLFYLSRGSLTSGPCYRELSQTHSREAKELHFGPVPFVVVEAEPVTDLPGFIVQLQQRVRECPMDKETKTQQVQALHRFREEFFPDNDRIRLAAKTRPGRIGSYETDLENELRKLRPCPRFSVEKRYRKAVEHLGGDNVALALPHLQACHEAGYVPGRLLLAHLYHAGQLSGGDAQTRILWQIVEQQEPAATWAATGLREFQSKFYSEALAYWLAAGDRFQDAGSYFQASKVWVKKGNRRLTLELIRQAARLGYPRAEEFLNRLQIKSDEEFMAGAKKFHDEAPIQ